MYAKERGSVIGSGIMYKPEGWGKRDEINNFFQFT
jgi:hypothetical protein